MRIGEVARIVGGRLVGPVDPEHWVRAVATDTRRLPPPPFAFVALRGPNFDGNSFAAEALAAGATVVLTDDPERLPTGAAGIAITDGLAALQALAGAWRARFTGTVVGITGSNGKTTVKEMAATILGLERRVYRSPGSYNSQVGVALALLGLPLDAEVALIECGVSRPGEMDRLQAMVRPDVGLLTHIGTAHLAGFGSAARIAEEKLKLFGEMAGSLAIHESARPYVGAEAGPSLVWVGRGEGNAVRVRATSSRVDGMRVVLELPDGSALDVDLASYADHDADNAACAVALAHLLGARPAAMAAGLEGYAPAPLRIEVHTSQEWITLINDSYSADPASMRSALRTLQRLAAGRRSVAVLGAMRDLGAGSEAEHRQVGERVAAMDVGLLVAVGPDAEPIAAAAQEAGMPPERVVRAPDPEATAAVLDERLCSGDVVLVKASRPQRLERTAEYLLESISPTRVYIDLGVIADNVRRVRAWIGSDVALFAVVKSFGYGSDVVRVSELLEQQGVAALQVAYPDEGVLLRRRGIQAPILVANVLPGEAEKIARHRLAAVVYTGELVEALARAAAAHGATIPVHVKLDTGMGRFGLADEELLPLAALVSGHPGLLLEGVMSHLSVAESAAQDAFTRGQIEHFGAAVERLSSAGYRPRYTHLANTGGILRFPEAHFTAVRLGLGLYGCVTADTGPAGSPELSPAIALHSRLVGLRELPAGHSVGYGRTFRTERRTRIGLVALGYSDGLPWAVSNRGAVWIRGHRAPIVGRVSMDVTTVDVTDLPEVNVGDDVVVFGDGEKGEPTVPELAEWAGTIPYEILCRISPRVRRIVRLAD